MVRQREAETRYGETESDRDKIWGDRERQGQDMVRQRETGTRYGETERDRDKIW